MRKRGMVARRGVAWELRRRQQACEPGTWAAECPLEAGGGVGARRLPRSGWAASLFFLLYVHYRGVGFTDGNH
jgi:hypothetical protein